MSDFTPTEKALPPIGAAIEWIAPSGRSERGNFLGGAVWMPEGSAIYVYHRPCFWRLIPSH